MCGRYTLTDVAHLGSRFNLASQPEGIHENFNTAPTQTMPVIIETSEGRQAEFMKWGIPRFIGPGKVKDVFNTRSDKAFGSWKKLVMSQRVLVPATGFYEWKMEDGGKQPYFIHPKDGGLFAFAGIWNTWKDEDGREAESYSIMTTEPNKEMSKIHNRMPVILHESDETTWLSSEHNNDQSALEQLLLPYNDNGLEVYPVSREVNTVRINDKRLMQPLNSQ